MKLSELLQISRKSRKLTLMDLVNKTGISYSMLYRILNGGLEKPTPDILEKLSEPLHLDYHYLLQVAGYIEVIKLAIRHTVIQSYRHSEVGILVFRIPTSECPYDCITV
jgi:transcriptional regulator with XRE-family HTH domain